MTTAPPPAHYGAVKGALASGFATAELHHLWGHDPRRCWTRGNSARFVGRAEPATATATAPT
ncbi:hypothetical protein CEJ86_32430 [Sinorhizobium meliloti]|uniref:Uncharacterized protein n=1 Tax=Rhizobium meliloti TaxID=382 RepID=A0A2J0YT32_RHIML|nr:hypothetical protein CEJ86_32430 [Sinorhizobium meliloti]